MAEKLPLTRDYVKRLDYLFGMGPGQIVEPELLAHWSRYMCVLVSGLLDVAIPELCTSYARNRSDPRVANFVHATLDNATNFKTERLLGTFSKFSPELRAELDAQLTDAQKDAVHSVVTLRNNIAHGRDSGISFVTMRDYFGEVKAAINCIGQVLGVK